jgi:hypothetical protein
MDETFLPKRNKYRAIKTTVPGCDHVFDSKREARRYQELMALFKGGYIRNLELQPVFICHVYDGQAIGKARMDFAYFEGSDRIVEDVKGHDTALSKWKRKHVEAEYKLKVRVVK